MKKEWLNDSVTKLVVGRIFEELANEEEKLKEIAKEGTEGDIRFCAGKIEGLEVLGHIIDEMEVN